MPVITNCAARSRGDSLASARSTQLPGGVLLEPVGVGVGAAVGVGEGGVGGVLVAGAALLGARDGAVVPLSLHEVRKSAAATITDGATTAGRLPEIFITAILP